MESENWFKISENLDMPGQRKEVMADLNVKETLSALKWMVK